MSDREATIEAVAQMITTDLEGFWLLIGPLDGPEEPRRRAALMTLLVAAYGKGYEKGLKRGAELLVGATR